MKRMHVHVAVDDLTTSINFYSALFAAEPSVVKPDYAKWMLDDPRVNFAISARGRVAGLDHLGIQVETKDELNHVYAGCTGQADKWSSREKPNVVTRLPKNLGSMILPALPGRRF
jgi:hypothetical protein